MYLSDLFDLSLIGSFWQIKNMVVINTQLIWKERHSGGKCLDASFLWKEDTLGHIYLNNKFECLG